MSRYGTYKYNKLVMNVLHAQTEMMMLNRSDILALSKNRAISPKQEKSYKSNEPRKPHMDEFRDMYE